MEKRKYKLLAFILILSLIFPFFPSVKASAAISPMPDFPYGQNDFYNVNNGYFALWQVHNSDYINYVQTFTPIIPQSANPIIIFNKTWLYSTYTYYLDYSFITDCWDSTGNHLSSLPVNKNIRVPRPNEDYLGDNVVYATLVFSTGDIWWTSGDGSGVYAYTNYYPDGYADPTPTPSPEQPHYFPTVTDARYTTLTYYDAVKLVMMRFYSESEQKYMIRYFTLFSERNRSNQLIGFPVVTFVSDDSGTVKVNLYNQIVGGYSLKWNMYISEASGISYFDSLEQIISTTVALSNHNNSVNSSTKISGDDYYFTYTPSGDYYFEDAIFGNINSDGTVDFDGSGGGVPSPTPTAIPTAIPQPTTNPNPTATPVPDVKIVHPGDHWWDGLVKPIEYIFVPSKDKMMRTYNVMSEKFGVQKPTKFEFSVDSLVRPDNVVWKFKHASLDGSDNTETQITLIDFEMIDGWLETSAGRMIIRIIRAVFGLLMWAYLMYIYRKHIATINYTDAETLKDISRNSGGGDEDV